MKTFVYTLCKGTLKVPVRNNVASRSIAKTPLQSRVKLEHRDEIETHRPFDVAVIGNFVGGDPTDLNGLDI